MQNSRLETKIIPNASESWQRFIARASSDLSTIRAANISDNNSMRLLNSHIKKIESIKEACQDNIEEILNHREFFTYVDQSLESAFNALEFLRDQNNFDNDAVMTIYNIIISSPKIIELNEKLSSLKIKSEFSKGQFEPLEALIRGKRIDQSFVQESLDKSDFGDKTKKDILFYSLISPLTRQKDAKNTKKPAVSRKEVLTELYRNKIKELCNKYKKMKEEYAPQIDKYFKIRQTITKEEKATCDKYADKPSEANDNGFSNDQLTKIYVTAVFKLKDTIESYIEALAELNMDNADLVTEISFLDELLNEYSSTIVDTENLISEDIEEIDDEDEISDDQVNVYFAFNYFYRLLFDTRLLEDNKTSINALIKKISSNANNITEGINATPMLGVEEAESLLDKKIYLIGKRNYKLAYIRVGNSILVLSIADSSDTKFDANLNRLVKEYYIGLQKQITKIEQKNEEYLNMQKNVRKEHLSGGKTI